MAKLSDEEKARKFLAIVEEISEGERFRASILKHWTMRGFHKYIADNSKAATRYERCLISKAGCLMAEYEDLLFNKENEEMHFTEKKVKLEAIEKMMGWLNRERFGKHTTKKVEGDTETAKTLQDIIKDIQKA